MIVIEVTDLNVVSIYLSVGSKARASSLSTFYFPAIVTADLRDIFGVTSLGAVENSLLRAS